MTATEKELIDRIDHLEARYANDKYAEFWLIPRELLIRLRDEIRQPMLPEVAADVIDFFQENGIEI